MKSLQEQQHEQKLRRAKAWLKGETVPREQSHLLRAIPQEEEERGYDPDRFYRAYYLFLERGLGEPPL